MDEPQYRVSRKDSNSLTAWLSKGMSNEVAKKLKAEFLPSFESKSFELTCPELDLSAAHRLVKLHKLDAVPPTKPMDQGTALIAN